MIVGERMTRPVFTVHPEEAMQDALKMMHTERIRRLPVVDRGGKLVGIVSESDLLHASPSDATTLSVWELNYLLSKITVKEVMTSDVISVTEDMPVEDAARIMADNRIGGLPVVRNREVVGIITETDLFKLFLEMLGAREKGVRASVLIHDAPGELARLTKAVFDIGGNIIALGTFLGETSENREVVIKVKKVKTDALKGAIQPVVEKILNMRET